MSRENKILSFLQFYRAWEKLLAVSRFFLRNSICLSQLYLYLRARVAARQGDIYFIYF